MFKTKACQYCGNNPIPHTTHWYFESVNVLFGPLRLFLLHNPISTCISSIFEKFSLGIYLVKVFHTIGIISYQTDVSKCTVRRAVVLWEEANRRGIEMKELLIFGKGFDTYVTRIKNKETEENFHEIVFSGLLRPRGYDDRALDAMDDKLLLKRKLSQAHIPVPQGGDAWNLYSAKKIFNTITKPVIVKPRSGSRGRHSTTFITTEKDLIKAYHIAKQLCFWVIVEEHLEGPVYRGTVINYKLEGVLRGDSPFVVGNGTNTIEKLISEKNSKSHPGVKDIVISPHIETYLGRQNLLVTSILENGKKIFLTEKIGVGYGGSSSEDFEMCHPDNKELFERAARVVGDPIIGFDFIIPDITKSYAQQRCGFLEANSLPFINLHHDPLLGKPRNVAGAVWDMIEKAYSV